MFRPAARSTPRTCWSSWNKLLGGSETRASCQWQGALFIARRNRNSARIPASFPARKTGGFARLRSQKILAGFLAVSRAGKRSAARFQTRNAAGSGKVTVSTCTGLITLILPAQLSACGGLLCASSPRPIAAQRLPIRRKSLQSILSISPDNPVFEDETRVLRRSVAVGADFFLLLPIFLLQPGPQNPISPLTGWQRGRSSGVEHYLAKVRVVSSNLIARSIGKRTGRPSGRPFAFAGLPLLWPGAESLVRNHLSA